MVNDYILICNNKIIDIFDGIDYFPNFAPFNLNGDKIYCIEKSEVILNNDNDIIKIGDTIDNNLKILKEDEGQLLLAEIPTLNYENLLIDYTLVDIFTLELIERGIL